MAKRLRYILNFSIIALFLLVEYLWFRDELGWPGIRFSFLGAGISISYIRKPAIILFLLICLKVFLLRRRIFSCTNNFLEKFGVILIDKEKRFIVICLFSILLFSLVVRVPELMYAEGHLDADEATEGIMAMHIYQGIHRPVNQYTLPYNSATRSYFTALLFNITGVSAKALRILPLIYIFTFLVFVYLLFKEIFNERVALLMVSLLSIPPPVFYFHTLSASTYIEVLLYGTIVLFLTNRYITGSSQHTPVYFISLIGFLWGFGFWSQPLMMVFILSSLIAIFFRDIKYFFKHILWRLIFFSFVGCFPLILFNIKSNYATIAFLRHPPKAPLFVPVVQRVKIIISSIISEFGDVDIFNQPFRGRYDVIGKFNWAMTIFFICLYIISTSYFFCRYRHMLLTSFAPKKNILGSKYCGFILTGIFTICFNLRAFRIVGTGRYVLPLYLFFMPLFTFWVSSIQVKWRYVKYLILVLFFCNNIYFIIQQISYSRERKADLAAVINKFEEMGIGYVGTGYWQAYPITFITGERIICTGRYGVSSGKAKAGDPILFDRYMPYREKFFKELKDNPQDVAFLFEGVSEYERKFVDTRKELLEKTVVGKYNIYTLKANTNTHI